MQDPEFDANGYPTDKTLRAIKRWPIAHPADTEALLLFVQRAWKYPDYIERSSRRTRRYRGGPLVRRWQVSTGGWSGNEDLIGALQDHWAFWTLAWVSSKRGGHYVFETP